MLVLVSNDSSPAMAATRRADCNPALRDPPPFAKRMVRHHFRVSFLNGFVPGSLPNKPKIKPSSGMATYVEYAIS